MYTPVPSLKTSHLTTLHAKYAWCERYGLASPTLILPTKP